MREDTVSILAAGWSVRSYVGELHRLPGVVIGVNDAGVLAPRVDVVLSMDRLWAEYRWPALMAFEEPRETWLRRSALQNIRERPAWLTSFENDNHSVDFTDDAARLNGTNSGMCALNRAYQIAPRRVLLFGFDMNRDAKNRAYWYEPYPWARPAGNTPAGRYRAWAAEFEIAARQFKGRGIEVLNLSPKSAIAAFPKAEPREVLA